MTTMATGRRGQILDSAELETIETSNLTLYDRVDTSKVIQFDVSNVPTGNTVVITLPGANSTIETVGQSVQNVAQGTIATNTVVRLHPTVSLDAGSGLLSIAEITSVDQTAFGLTSASFPAASSQVLITSGLHTTTFTATVGVGSPIFYTAAGALSEVQSGSVQIGVLVTSGVNAQIYFSFVPGGSSQIETGGTAPLPSLALEGDATSGFYSTGPGIIQASCGTTELLKLENTNNTVTIGDTNNIVINDTKTEITGPVRLTSTLNVAGSYVSESKTNANRLPVVSTTNRNLTTPSAGDVLFNPDSGTMNIYTGIKWVTIKVGEDSFTGAALPTFVGNASTEILVDNVPQGVKITRSSTYNAGTELVVCLTTYVEIMVT